MLAGLIKTGRNSIIMLKHTREAKKGNPESQYLLGKYWVDNDNYIEAYMWYEISATNGNENGLKYRELLKKEMANFQIVQAQKMAKEWMEEQE